MHSPVLGLRVAGTIFGLVCLGQLLRVVTRADVTVAGHPIPIAASVVAVVVAGGLAVWMWMLSSTVDKTPPHD